MTELKLLLIDDDEIFQDLFRDMLENLGFSNVECKSSSREALLYLEKSSKNFDCIFIDIMMPGIDGIDLCQMIRKISSYREAYIIMISGGGDANSINDCFLAGAMDFISKPFHPMEIRSRLRVARKLLAERRENCNKDTVIKVLQQKLESRSRQDANWRSSFVDIDGFLSFPDFEDKLLRSRKSTLVASDIFGVSVIDISSLNKSVSHSMFHDAVSRIARHISRQTSEFQRLITYIGDGKFICLCSKESQYSSSKSITEVLRRKSEVELDIGSDARYLVRLNVFDPVRGNGLFLESPIKLIYAVNRGFLDHDRRPQVFHD